MGNEQPPSGYTVGYKKPPRQGQFKKGKSGNPSGRPKGTPNFATALEQVLSEQVVINEGGQRRTITKLEAAVKQLVNKATMGDSRATQQLLKVLSALDGDSTPASQPTLALTASDEQVMDSIAQRIRTTTPQGGPNVPTQPDGIHERATP